MTNKKSFLLLNLFFLLHITWIHFNFVEANERVIYIQIEQIDQFFADQGIFYQIDASLDADKRHLGTGYSICNENIARIKIEQPADREEYKRFELKITAINRTFTPDAEQVNLKKIGQPIMRTVDFEEHSKYFSNWVAILNHTIVYQGFLPPITRGLTEKCAEFYLQIPNVPNINPEKLVIIHNLSVFIELPDNRRGKISETSINNEQPNGSMFRIPIENDGFENKQLVLFPETVYIQNGKVMETARSFPRRFFCTGAPVYVNSPNYYMIDEDWNAGTINCRFMPKKSGGKKVLRKKTSFKLFGSTIESESPSAADDHYDQTGGQSTSAYDAGGTHFFGEQWRGGGY